MKSNKEEILQNWKTTCVDLDSLPSKIAQLREEQHSYAEQEDFDKAAEIQQEIHDLVRSKDDFKYQHPLLDEKVCWS